MKKSLLPLAIAALATNTQAGTVTTDGADIKLNTKGGLSAETADGMASVELGGRIQWDYDATEAEAYGVDEEDVDLRRGRLFVGGHYGDWAYKVQFNVGEGDAGGDAEDLYIRYTGFGSLATLTLGKQREPFGFQQLVSSKDISLLERSAVTEQYAPSRNSGLQLHGKGANWTYGVGVFEADGDGDDDFGETALTGRVTFAPIKTDATVLHLGAGYSSRGEVDGDPLTSEDLDVYNLELAGALGPFHAQAEFFEAEVSSDLGDADTDGWYVQAGWVITGETRPYRDGIFRRVKAAGEGGAWEVVLRHEEGFGRYSDVGLTRAEGEQTALGLNWYLNSNVRLGLSYMDGEEDVSGAEGDELRARVQFTF